MIEFEKWKVWRRVEEQSLTSSSYKAWSHLWWKDIVKFMLFNITK